MLLLEKGNRILQEVVAAILLREADEKPSACDVKLCDFDDVSYQVVVDAADLTTLIVSMNLPCYEQIADKGGKVAFETAFEGLFIEAANGYHCTVKINVDDYKEEAKAEELVGKLATMKSIVVGGTFQHFFNACIGGEEIEQFSFELRGDTTLYFCPRGDSLVVVFGVDFVEDVDKVVGKVFLQELQNCKAGRSPPCNWSIDPPLEVQAFGVTENPGILGYISFALQKSHMQNNAAEAIHVLQTFRSFLQYHIKMSKSYWHSRMRARSLSLLKVLNRAKVEDPNAAKNKKTASGKRFGPK